jgi:DNA-binding NarL/FixJ family response regulator
MTTSAIYGQPLTPRESQVCEYLCLGWTNKEIAQALSLSSRTIEDHRSHVYDKHGVRNSVELVRKVYGITEFGPDAKAAMEIVG